MSTSAASETVGEETAIATQRNCVVYLSDELDWFARVPGVAAQLRTELLRPQSSLFFVQAEPDSLTASGTPPSDNSNTENKSLLSSVPMMGSFDGNPYPNNFGAFGPPSSSSSSGSSSNSNSDRHPSLSFSPDDLSSPANLPPEFAAPVTQSFSIIIKNGTG